VARRGSSQKGGSPSQYPSKQQALCLSLDGLYFVNLQYGDFYSGMKASTDLLQLFVHQISIRGFYAGTLQEFKDLIVFAIAKDIKPHIRLVLPLGKANERIHKMMDGKYNVEIVITA
jgi:D-arabinose 1-dehydrogenase-like Zn-dependent alcohol dehydrogenase